MGLAGLFGGCIPEKVNFFLEIYFVFHFIRFKSKRPRPSSTQPIRSREMKQTI